MLDEMLFTICPWWDGPITRDGIAAQLAEAAPSSRTQAVDLDPSRAAGQVADQLGRHPLFRRHRACAVDRRVPAGHRVLAATCISRPSSRTAPGSTASATTWVFNAGQQFGAPPTHIIIDTEAGEALWFSSAGNQFIRLSEPLERPVPRLEAIPDWLKAADRPSASGPGVNSSCCWWISVSSTSPTMPR